MSVRHRPRRIASVVRATPVLAVAVLGCGPPAPAPTTHTWVVGQAEPRFDPSGPPHAVRWALERLLSQGLVAEDTTGRIVQAAARRWDVTPNGLTYTFHLRPDLRFGDGRPCTSTDFRRALESGLNRLDHGTYAWLLSPVVGVDRVRPGRPLPALGIVTPDPRTLVLRLDRADPTLLHKLALPGASAPWSAREGGGGWEGGIGPYRVARRDPGRRLILARRPDTAGPDTVRIEFAASVGRARGALRDGRADLLWPVPPGMLALELPPGYRSLVRNARPERRLWLVMRPDLRPTFRVAGRRALAHGLNRVGILAALGSRARAARGWLTGAGAIDFPRHDPASVREWLRRGRYGRAMHAMMGYASDGVGAEVARTMQIDWAGMALDVELRPLRQGALSTQALGRQGVPLLLMESQALADDPVAELAALVEPRHLPPIGPFRTGWRTREFDAWIGPQPPATPLDAGFAQRRLREELVAIPLARLPWEWVERTGGAGVALHRRFGPGPAGTRAVAADPHSR